METKREESNQKILSPSVIESIMNPFSEREGNLLKILESVSENGDSKISDEDFCAKIGLDVGSVVSKEEIKKLIIWYIVDQNYHVEENKQSFMSGLTTGSEVNTDQVLSSFAFLLMPFGRKDGEAIKEIFKNEDIINAILSNNVITTTTEPITDKGSDEARLLLEIIPKTDFAKERGFVLSRGENELEDPELNNKIDELLADFEGGRLEPATIAEHMQDLYIVMQEKNDVVEYKYKTENVFKKLAPTVGLQEDSTLYRMCVTIAEGIDQTDSKQELPYHNKQHFTEAVVSCLVLGKVKGLDDDTIGKLLFTALIHDFRYEKAKELLARVQNSVENENPIIPTEYEKYLYIETTTNEKGETVNTVKFKASGIEQYSCDQAEQYLKQEFKIEEGAELPNEIENQLNFSRAIIATTDIFSDKSTELVRKIKSGELSEFKSDNVFLNKSAQYFADNPQAIEAMKTMLEADIFSSCILEKLFEIKTRELLLGELKLPLTGSKLWETYLNFLNKNAVPYFGEGHFFSKEFETIENNAKGKLEDELQRERPDERKLEEERVRGFLLPFLFFLASLSFCFISIMISFNYFNFVY